MAMWVSVKSACGDKETSMDIYDAEENPFGVECCPKCVVIIADLEKARELEEKGNYLQLARELEEREGN
jgi:hypothetical protein